jgi:hypothetical protein
VAEDDVHIHASMSGDVTEALDKATVAAEEAEHAVESLGHAGSKAGRELETGMDKVDRSTGRARDALGRFIPMANAAGDAALKSGAKAAIGAKGYDKLKDSVDGANRSSSSSTVNAKKHVTQLEAWAKSADKASRATGGLKSMIMLIKWGAILTGGQAVVGMLVSLGSGAVMAVGHMAPLVGVAGALGPAFFLAAAGMALMKISGKDIGALLRPLTNDFLAMRTEITQAMVPGLQAFSREIHDRLVPTIKSGLVSLGGSFGKAAATVGDMVTQTRTVGQIGVLFHGLDPIIQLLAGSLGHVLVTLINLAVAALPMTTSMAQGLNNVTEKLDAWSKRMTDSGRAQAFMARAWNQMKTDGRILRDLLIGLYHLFSIAGGVARDQLGGGMESAAAKFRAWTTSAEGAARITKFFMDSVPILKETGQLLMALLRGIGGIGTSPAVAALIAQIRTELLPALGLLFHNLSGASTGGFGSALVSAFTQIALALSKIPLGGLTLILQAVAALAGAIVWLVANVPGLGPAIGIFLTLFTVFGAGAKVAGVALRIFDKAEAILKWTRAVSALGILLKWVAPVLDIAGTAIMGIGRAIAVAFASNPIGVIIIGIMLVVLAFIYLWNKFAWFRDGVKAVGRAVVDVFIWIARAAAAPFVELWNIIKGAYNLIAKGWNLIPTIHVPEWIPFIGGKDFNLPKMPLLAHGGTIEYSTAIVGEQGPEALVKGGQFLGMIGTRGPELRTDLPPGGYVVPNLSTLNKFPMLADRLPASVADAVAGAVPGYGALLGRGNSAPGSPHVSVNVDTGSQEVVDAINDLTAAVLAGNRRAADPPATTRSPDRFAGLSDRYRYSSPRRP